MKGEVLRECAFLPGTNFCTFFLDLVNFSARAALPAAGRKGWGTRGCALRAPQVTAVWLCQLTSTGKKG